MHRSERIWRTGTKGLCRSGDWKAGRRGKQADLSKINFLTRNSSIYFKAMTEKFGPDVAHIGEIMIGMNPHSPLNLEGTTLLQAHRRAGTVHIAYGNSVDDFRRVKPGIHIDNLIIKPTITLDGNPILKNDRLLMLDEP